MRRNTKEGETKAALRSSRLCCNLRQNKSPFACASGDWGEVISLSTSHASPNAANGVIVIIVVGEGGGLHGRHYSTNFFFFSSEFTASFILYLRPRTFAQRPSCTGRPRRLSRSADLKGLPACTLSTVALLLVSNQELAFSSPFWWNTKRRGQTVFHYKNSTK